MVFGDDKGDVASVATGPQVVVLIQHGGDIEAAGPVGRDEQGVGQGPVASQVEVFLTGQCGHGSASIGVGREVGNSHTVVTIDIFVDYNWITHTSPRWPLPASLTINAAQRALWYILLGMRNGDSTRFLWMLEMVVTATNMNQQPSIVFQSGDDFTALHMRIIHIIHTMSSFVVDAVAC